MNDHEQRLGRKEVYLLIHMRKIVAFFFFRVLLIKISRFWCLGRHQPPQVTETAKIWRLTFMALSQKQTLNGDGSVSLLLNVSSHFTFIGSFNFEHQLNSSECGRCFLLSLQMSFLWSIISSTFNLEESTVSISYWCVVSTIRGAGT